MQSSLLVQHAAVLRPHYLVFCWLVFCLAAFAPWATSHLNAEDTALHITDTQATALFENHCYDCHSAEDAEAGLDMETLATGAFDTSSLAAWSQVVDRIRSGQMPPPDAETLPSPDRDSLVAWAQESIRTTVSGDGIQPGSPMVRRLNRNEYANTIRDLLGIQVNAGHALPSEGAGGEGFDNAAETLFVSPIHAEKYLDAARTALGHAMADPELRAEILIAQPSDAVTPEAAAKQVLQKFLPRAFRRPTSESEVESYVGLFQNLQPALNAFPDAVQATLEAALVSPKFLFIYEESCVGDEAELISQYELASRLSYFLWSSMPDSTLFELAKAGKLDDAGVLESQVRRMLSSSIRGGLRPGAKVRQFAESFSEQWLGTRALGRTFTPDPSIAPSYNSELEGGMKYEPVFFFEDLLAENKSLLNWLDADFTYVNRHLAKHYGLDGSFREQPKLVQLPDGSVRGGVLGMSAVLAVSSRPQRTSPVLRGKWILDTLLGAAPPPPPPDVGELSETDAAGNLVTLREQLEAHRSNSSCSSCHASMDPLGFGLENFDVLGRWRTDLNGLPVDARGELPDGTQFTGPNELKKILLSRKDEFIRHFTRKMLGYALSRGLTYEDECVAGEIADKLPEDDYKAQTLIIEIVSSIPFRYKMKQ